MPTLLAGFERYQQIGFLKSVRDHSGYAMDSAFVYFEVVFASFCYKYITVVLELYA